MRFVHGRRRAVIAALAGMVALAGAARADVNLYTMREPGLVKPLIESFTRETGIKVNTVFMDKGLAERVVSEGAASPADILMAVDVGNLVDFVDKGITQPLASRVLEAAVPAQLRSPAGEWFALSMRARLFYAVKDEPSFAPPVTYEELADPRYKGKVCIRSGQHPYNTALIAAMIAHDGEARAEDWLRGVKANLARKAGGGDREVARDILGGLCDVGIGNSYYVGLMRSGRGGPEQQKWGDGIAVVLPTFAAPGSGTHVNISGASLARNAPNRDEAVKFLEYLVSDEAQKIYAEQNFEYPVKPGVPVSPVIAALGPLKIDTLPLGEIVRFRKAASELAQKVGFDN